MGQVTARLRRWRLLGAVLGVGLGASAGCASSGLGDHLRENARAEIRARGLDPASVLIPFEATAQMKQWVASSVPRNNNLDIQLNWLLQSVLSRGAPQLRYVSGYTGTSAEVFERGSANCLGFTQMFVALARELELPVYFLRVSDLQSFEREGDLIVASAHITAALGPPSSRRILDFAERPVSAYRWVEAISDLTAIALYYSNRGAEELREGRNEEGLELLRIATRVDPELAEAWVNVGVAERRSGNSVAAEAAYRRALEVDATTVSAYQNLAGLLRVQGRSTEAEELLGLTDRAGNRNPYSYLALGDLSLRQGRISEAERFYRRAIRLDPEQAEAQAAMGHWALRAGKPREAQKFLRRAQKIDPANDRVDALSRSLSASTPQS